MDRRHIEIAGSARLIMEAAAIEVFPCETYGLLLGENGIIAQAYPSQCVTRTETKVSFEDEPQERLIEKFGSLVIGDFHSHPNEHPTLSRPRDFRLWRDKIASDAWDLLTEPHIGDGFASVILSLWPGKRKPWCFRWMVYVVVGNRIRKGRIEWI